MYVCMQALNAAILLLLTEMMKKILPFFFHPVGGLFLFCFFLYKENQYCMSQLLLDYYCSLHKNVYKHEILT